jgi:CubicO group peptidase (beta-lactamase class C family)
MNVVKRLIAVFMVLAYSDVASGQPAVFPGTGWQEASPESQGVNSEKLKAAVAYFDENGGPQGAKELVIIRNGYLIWKGPDCDNYHNVWSCTKTFTSTVLGLLIADGKCALDDPAVKYLLSLDDRYPEYARIKLRHLASMSAGYRGEVVNVTEQQPWGEPAYYLNPTKPLFDAGTKVQYNDHEVLLLGSILTRLAGESERALFKRRIADPIGMTRFDWGVSGKVNGIELNNAAGTPTTPGVQTTARQMARFGLLYLNRGYWNGKQLLPASFVDEAGRNQVAADGASKFLYHRYGLYWWTNGVRPDGRRPWPSAPPRTYTAHGHSCNFCYIIREWNMVVVRMGTVPLGTGVSALAKQDVLWDTFFAKVAEALSGDRN